MWFTVALLMFCAVYAVVRLAGPKDMAIAEHPRLPRHRDVTRLILLMGSCAFVVRISQPIGVNTLNMQLCYFSQYVLLFGVGILAYRGDWLGRIPYSFGIGWMKWTLIACVPGWIVLILTSGALQGDTQSPSASTGAAQCFLFGSPFSASACVLASSFFFANASIPKIVFLSGCRATALQLISSTHLCSSR
jgi:glucans biosynthesis protein C